LAAHGTFNYRSLDELQAAAARLGLADLAFDEDVSILAQPVALGRRTAPNALVSQPMEGCDGTPDGSPGPLSLRRYQRFAGGGAGIVWFEACAVVPEGRNHPRQLWLHLQNQAAFAHLLRETLAAARDQHGQAHRPLALLQLTHSGRYSQPAPALAHHSPFLDPQRGIGPDYPLVSDDYLDSLQEAFLAAARLAAEAGFDGVDVKACHGYLVGELLAAHTRPGRYGGSYQGRRRFLLETVERIHAELPDLLLASRLGVYDAIAYPYGWGVDRKQAAQPDLAEPVRLVGELAARGVSLVNLTIGNPYYNPHYGRPYDRPAPGGYLPDEHPLQGVARIVAITRQIAQAAPGVAVVAFGYSWLRQFAGCAAAANVRRGWARLLGLGRMSLAYPDYPRDLLAQGAVNPRRTCRACSRCTQIMRDGGEVGCPVMDPEVYLPIYRRGRRTSRSP